MLSYLASTATSYFHLPIDEEEDKEIEAYERKYLTWTPDPSSPSSSGNPNLVDYVLSHNDLYQVLGLVNSSKGLDKIALRRAYLSRSRSCHPDKFPTDKANATLAFQKIAVAYKVLSDPSAKKRYDTQRQRSSASSSPSYDVFASQPSVHADETLYSVVMSVFNDFLDGDLEMIRTFLRAINDMNPSLSLGDEAINSVLTTLQTVRERALTCRACIYALHTELLRLIEIQHALRQLSYFDLFGRSRLTIELTRIAIRIPITIDRAVARDKSDSDDDDDDDGNGSADSPVLIPRHLTLLIRGVDGALGRVERILS